MRRMYLIWLAMGILPTGVLAAEVNWQYSGKIALISFPDEELQALGDLGITVGVDWWAAITIDTDTPASSFYPRVGANGPEARYNGAVIRSKMRLGDLTLSGDAGGSLFVAARSSSLDAPLEVMRPPRNPLPPVFDSPITFRFLASRPGVPTADIPLDPAVLLAASSVGAHLRFFQTRSSIAFEVDQLTANLGDTNGDGAVNLDDLNNVRNHFGAVGADDGSLPGDAVPWDGVVNIDDLNAVRNHFGAVATPAPEPSSLAIATLLFVIAAGWPKRSPCSTAG